MMKNTETNKAAWKDSMKRKLNSLKNGIDRQKTTPTILRVPTRIRRHDNAAYDPQIVSIGPYHRGKEKLHAFEKHKWQYLYDFLSRNEVSLDEFLDYMQRKEQEARNYYSEDISLRSNEFMEMITLDCCFVLELFLKFGELRPHESPDPICDSMLVWDTVGHDLLLVENQLPFPILSHIFNTHGPSNHRPPLDQLATNFFREVDDILITNSAPVPMESTRHLLHLLHQKLVPPLPPQLPTQNHNCLLLKMKNTLPSSCSDLLPVRMPESNNHPSQSTQPIWNIPSVQGLQEAGVKIRKANKRSFLDIKFNKGVMEIPYLDIDDFTNIFLRNMIAYEQIHSPERSCFTLYAYLMDDLINTTKDVEELTYKGIIENSLGSHEDVIVLFDQIGKGTVASWDDYSLKMIAGVNHYCSSKQHVWRAKLVHDYFSNPWAIFSLIAALVLLLLAFMQTLFSILSYVRPPSSS